MPAGEQVVVLIRVKEMYISIPKNCLSIMIIESISTDGTAIPPIIINPGKMIIAYWFYKNMLGHELVIVSDSGYTNKGICLAWLDHFIKYHDYRLDKPQHLLLIDSATCHKAPEFVIRAKIYKI